VSDPLASFPRTFWILWAGTLVNRLGLVVLPFLTLFLTLERGLTIEHATLLLGLYGGGAFVASFVGGARADRYGRRPVLLGSLVGGALSILAIPFAPSPWGIAAAVLAAGFLGEMYRPAVSAAVADLVEAPSRPRAFALLYWAINLGAAAAPVLGGLLAEQSYTLLFVLDASTMLAYAVVAAVGIPETRPVLRASDDLPLPTGPGAGFREALGDGVLMSLTAVALLVGAVFFQAYSTLPVVIRSAGFSNADYGYVIALNGALIVLLSLPVARWAGRQAPGLLLAAAVALIGIGMASHGAASTLVGYGLGVVIWTLGEIAFLPVLPAYIANLAPDGARATYQGVYGAGFGLSHMIGPVVGGFALGQLGAGALWTGCLFVSLLAAGGLLALRPALRRRLAPAA
jgi:MFS family permease